MGGYVFQPFPKCKYHPDGRVVIVQDAGEEQALGSIWADRPFPPAPLVEDPPPLSVSSAPPPVKRGRGRPRKVVDQP